MGLKTSKAVRKGWHETSCRQRPADHLSLVLQGLLPIYINPKSGELASQRMSMGAMGDSYCAFLDCLFDRSSCVGIN